MRRVTAGKPARRPCRRATLAPCSSSAWSTSARVETRRCCAGWPLPPAPRCSTSTVTPTTTAPSSRWPGPPTWWPKPPGPWPTATLAHLDLRRHTGAHPRLGVLDVVPFVPYEPGRPAPDDLAAAVTQRDRFARWLGEDMGVPSFLYGPLPGGRARTLPEIRRLAFGPAPDGLIPDHGPMQADPRSGATAVGARRVLVAYNVWVSSVEVARQRGASGAQPRGPCAGPGRRDSGPGLVQPGGPRPLRAGPALRRGGGARAPGGRQGRRRGAGGAHSRVGLGHRALRPASRTRPVGGGDGGVPAPRPNR